MQIPENVAIIMDGNGRWAKKRNLPRTAGHKKGVDVVRDIALEANRMGIKHLILYSFSTENWTRPDSEVSYLCKLPGIFFSRFIGELMENQIKVVFSGELSAFPESTQKVILKAVEQTKDNTGLVLDFAINYGGHQELLRAIKTYAQEVASGKRENDLNEEDFYKYLYVQDPVDLLIRTSGEQRLSNFLPWQSAYSELIFEPDPWPEFDEEHLHKAIEIYNQRDRRFGGLKNED